MCQFFGLKISITALKSTSFNEGSSIATSIKYSRFEADSQLHKSVFISFISLKDLSMVAVPTCNAVIMFNNFTVSGNIPLYESDDSISWIISYKLGTANPCFCWIMALFSSTRARLKTFNSDVAYHHQAMEQRFKSHQHT